MAHSYGGISAFRYRTTPTGKARTMRRCTVKYPGFALLLGLLATAPTQVVAQWYDLNVSERPSSDNLDLEIGREIYQESCWFCHGEDGDGDGPISPYLFPRPRDFTMGSYKLRTTQSGELPLDEDLFRTITLGIDGTAMPGWEPHLTEEERWQVINYIKGFASDLFEDEFFDTNYENINDMTIFEGSHNGYVHKYKKIIKRKLIISHNENKVMGEDSIISLKAKDEKIVYHIRFHLMPGINTNVTNNKKNIILKTKKNNIWIFKSNSEITIENSIYVNNNTTKEIQQIVIKGITSKGKQIEKWSIEKM